MRAYVAALILTAALATQSNAQCVGNVCYYPAPTVVGWQAGYSVRPTLFGRGWRIKPRLAPVLASPAVVAPAVVPQPVIPMQLQAVPQTYYRYEWRPVQPTPAAQPAQPGTTSRERSILADPPNVRPSATIRAIGL